MSTETKDTLFTEVEALRAERDGFREFIARQDERIALYEEEVDRLREMLVQMQKQAFGPKSERWETEEQGKILLNEAEVEAAKLSDSETEEADAPHVDAGEVYVAAHTKKRGHRRPLPEHLKREIIEVELPEDQRFDAAGNALRVVGKEISEKLCYEPAKITVIEYHRFRYGVDAGEPVKTAPPVPSIIPKGIATAFRCAISSK